MDVQRFNVRQTQKSEGMELYTAEFLHTTEPKSLLFQTIFSNKDSPYNPQINQ